MHLIDVTKQLGTEEQCLAYIEKMRWPNGVRCVTCGGNEISTISRDVDSETKNKRAKLYQCLEPTCKQQFTATSGTIFHDTHLPLSKWFMAIALIVDAKKGISAKQLERTLQINYRTAWHLSHRIRHAMKSDDGLFSGTVEIDEVYIGGKQRGHKGKLKNKDCVLGIRQRGGNLKLVKIPNRSQAEIEDAVLMHVDPSVERIITDDMASYKFGGTALHNAKHDRINHSRKVYVKGDIHTNTVESSFSLLRRAIIGSYHQLSIKHLQRYLDEFSYRYNRREAKDIFEQTVTNLSGGTALPYKKLVARV